MGVSYLVFTLNDESAAWLQKNGTKVDHSDGRSRYPTLSELREVLSSLDGYASEERTGGNSVDFEISDIDDNGSGWSATIWAKSEDNKLTFPDDDEVVRFTFHKGDPELVVLICEKLTRRCGPLVLILDFDGRALLVDGKVEAEAVNKWLGE